MSEQPKCENCGGTNIEYWEKMKSWRNVFDIDEDGINMGKEVDTDIYDNGFMCVDCLEEQSRLTIYEKNFME